MKFTLIFPVTLKQRMVFFAGCLSVLVVSVLEIVLWQEGSFSERFPVISFYHLIHSYLNEGVPILSSSYVIRSFTIGVTAFLLLVPWTDCIEGGNQNRRVSLIGQETKKILFSICGVYLIFLLFCFSPTVFHQMSLEDHLVEWFSALLLLLSSFIFVWGLVCSKGDPVIVVSDSVLAILFFVIAMEEVSWFQRLLEFDTPELLSTNFQGELNLHNFATNWVENGYYFGAFTFLVVFPYFRKEHAFFPKKTFFEIFVPRPFIALIACYAFSFNYDMWNGWLTQLSFFGTLIVLGIYFVQSENSVERIYCSVSLCIMVLIQSVFLFYGDMFVRLWDVTEYKELLIPLSFLFYSLDVVRSQRDRVKPSSGI